MIAELYENRPDGSRKKVYACAFCGSPAVALFSMPAGCTCRPDDREQELCMQHAMKATPLGGMFLVQDFTQGTHPGLDRWRKNDSQVTPRFPNDGEPGSVS